MDCTETRYAGVDTHRDTHALCMLDGLGRKIYEGDFPADGRGYAALAEAIGSPRRCVYGKVILDIWHAGIRHSGSEHADHNQCLFLSCFGNDKKGWEGI